MQGRSSKDQSDWRAIILGIAAVLLFHGSVATFQAYYSFADLASLHEPHRYQVIESVRRGIMPLWSHEIQAGFPLHAESELGLFYPVNLLLFLTGMTATVSITLSILLHSILGLVGMYRFSRILNRTPPAALLSALGFALGSFMVCHTMQLNMVVGLAWLPWVLAGVARMLNRPDRPARTIAGLAVTTAMMALGGHPQVVFYNLLLVLLLGLPLAAGYPAGGGFRGRIAALAGIGGGISLGLIMAAVQWLPTLEFVSFSLRKTAQPQMIGRLMIRDLLSFLVPTIWRGGGTESARAHFSHDFSHEYACYVGMLPMLLAGWVMLTRPALSEPRSASRRESSLVAGCCLATGLAILLSFGGKSRLFAAVTGLLPLVHFSTPARMILLAGFSLLLLGGIGFDRLIDSRIRIHRATLAAVLIAALTGLAWEFTRSQDLLKLMLSGPRQNRILVSLGVGIVSLLLLILVRRRQAGWARWSLPIMVAADLWFFLGSYNPTVTAENHAAPNVMAETILADPNRGRIYSMLQLTASDFPPELLPPDRHVRYGISGVDTSFSLALDENKTLARGLRQEWRVVGDSIQLRSAEPFYQLGIRFLLSTRPIQSDAVIERVRSNGVVLSQFRRESPLVEIGSSDSAGSEIQPRLDFPTANETIISFEPGMVLESPLTCLVRETWYPGWHAEVNGVPMPIHKRGIFQEFTIPAGPAQAIRMKFKPVSVRIGLFLTLLGWCGVGVVLGRTPARAVDPGGAKAPSR